MPKTKAVASFSGMIDSDMEQQSDVEMMPTPDSNQENAEPGKKGKGRPKSSATKVRRTKPASRRLSGGSKPKATAKKKAIAKRAPLKEQANEQGLSEIEEVENFPEEIQETTDRIEPPQETEGVVVPAKKEPAKRGRAAKTKQPAKKDVIEEVKAMEKENDGEFEYTPTATRQAQPAIRLSEAAKKIAVNKRQASTEPSRIIPEEQPSPVDVEEKALLGGDEEADDLIQQSVYRQVSQARANSKQRQPSVTRRRAGSASDTERGGNDPATRRKLGEMTKKFENLDLKYRNLREVGIKEAESNFEKLRKQSEERTKGIDHCNSLSMSRDIFILILCSRERPNHRPKSRPRHPKIPRLHNLHPAHRPRHRSRLSHNRRDPHRRTHRLPDRRTIRKQSSNCQTRRLTGHLRVRRVRLCLWQDARKRHKRQDPDGRDQDDYGRECGGGAGSAGGGIEGGFVWGFDGADFEGCGEGAGGRCL